jgi:protein ImuB
MLWLCLHLPQLPLSALGTLTDAPVVDQRGPHRWLITGTEQVRAGTPLAQALVIEPALRVRPRRPDAEQAALRSLAYAAYGYGQPVCAEIQDLHEPGRRPRALLWVEVGSSLSLFGGLERLRDALCSELVELGHAAQIGIAPTRAGAALLACAGHSDPVGDLQMLRAQLDGLPIRLLSWPREVLHALHGVGLQRLGDLFTVPREAFSKRFGTQCRLALDRLLGEVPDPFDALVPPDTFRRRFELGAEIEDTERLQFPLRRLCAELQAYLRARDRGLRGVTLCVMHANARETRLHAQFVDPHRDAKRLFDALHERLERDGLPLPARELILIAEDFAEASVPQSDLFDPRASQAQAWAAALERIRGRLGEAKAWTLQATQDHRPERSVQRVIAAQDAANFQPSAQDRLRPALLLPEPWIMPAPQLSPETCFERIESGWWDGQDIRREYTALDINGARGWVFRDLATQRWYLHGWFA